MRRRRQWLVFALAACAVLLALALWAFPGDHEPSYNGKKLSQWAEIFYDGKRDRRPDVPLSAAQEEGRRAIREIGTNALRVLLEWTGRETPAWKTSLSTGSAATFINQNTLSEKLFGNEMKTMTRAVACFDALGPKAAPAIPDLELVMNRPWQSRGLSHIKAMRALALMGDIGVPPLLRYLTNPAVQARGEACIYLGQMGTNAVAAVPVLVKCLQDTNIFIATAAAGALGRLALEPDLVVPALIQVLKVPGREPKCSAILALAQFGEAARPAVPALLQQLTTDPYMLVRQNTIRALKLIAPNELPKTRMEHSDGQ